MFWRRLKEICRFRDGSGSGKRVVRFIEAGFWFREVETTEGFGSGDGGGGGRG